MNSPGKNIAVGNHSLLQGIFQTQGWMWFGAFPGAFGLGRAQPQRSSCGGILEFRRGIQSSSCVGPGKSYLPFEFKGRAGVVWKGFPAFPAHLRMRPVSRGNSRRPRGVRPRLEGKPRTPLSSRVATRVSWSPLSALNRVKPPLQFGEIREPLVRRQGSQVSMRVARGSAPGFPVLHQLPECDQTHVH